MTEKKVLIVEDEPVFKDILIHTCKAAGYSVDSANDGIEALEKFKIKKYGIILTDLMMPNMSGDELVTEVKKLAPTTITILITGQASLQSAITALQSGCDDYVLKPLEDIGIIHSTIKRAIDRRRHLENAVIHKRISVAKSKLIHKVSDDIISPAHSMIVASEKLSDIVGEDMYADHERLRKQVKIIQDNANSLADVAGLLVDSSDKLKATEGDRL